MEKPPKKDVQWFNILQWWLDPTNAETIPDRKQVSGWFDYVSKNFSYKFNWGLGSVIAFMIDDVHEGRLKETKLDEWHLTGLSWVVLWIKELITWGTLEPVAAYLLAQGMEFTRENTEKAAMIYYQSNSIEEVGTNNLLDPRKIRDWALQSLKVKRKEKTTSPPSNIQVELKRDFRQTSNHTWRVLPVTKGDKSINWFDPAGYLLAVSITPDNWDNNFLMTMTSFWTLQRV